MATAERDYYEILGVGPGCRRRATSSVPSASSRASCIPDVSEAPDAEERFREAAEAYEVLSDPERRATYDRYGREGLRGGGFTPADFDLGNLSDIFGAFFGESLFGQTQPGPEARAAAATSRSSVEISLADAFTGVSVSVPTRVARTCETCGGNGAAPGTAPVTCEHVRRGRPRAAGLPERIRPVRPHRHLPELRGPRAHVETPCATCDGLGRTLHDRALDVDIPAGIARRATHPRAGRGSRRRRSAARPATSSSRSGCGRRPGIERDGDDLHTVVELTMTQAALGTSLSVPGPEGEIEVEIPAGTQPGDVQVLRGQGMPSLEGDGDAATSTCTPGSTCRGGSTTSSARSSNSSARRSVRSRTATTRRRRLLRADQERVPLSDARGS